MLNILEAETLDVQSVYDAIFATEVEQQFSLIRENWKPGSGAPPSLREVLDSKRHIFPFGTDLQEKYNRGARVLQQYHIVRTRAYPTKHISSEELGDICSIPVLREAGYVDNTQAYELVALQRFCGTCTPFALG